MAVETARREVDCVSKPVRTRRQIFGIPTLLAALTLVALIIGLIGGEGLGWLAWLGTAIPLVVIAWFTRAT